MSRPSAGRLTMYGRPSPEPGLEWSWVRAELAESGSYWVVAAGRSDPHPRPVWGVWADDRLHLSIGSPILRAVTEEGAAVSVHLPSDVDVVIVDSVSRGTTSRRDIVERYNRKYDWDYTIDEYGPLTVLEPVTVLAWRSAGWAGRDGFGQTGRWTFEPG